MGNKIWSKNAGLTRQLDEMNLDISELGNAQKALEKLQGQVFPPIGRFQPAFKIDVAKTLKNWN